MGNPLYKHDCNSCQFVKTDKDDFGRISDIYVCGDCVTFRYSDEPPDNRSICFNPQEKDFEWYKDRNIYAFNILAEYKSSMSNS